MYDELELNIQDGFVNNLTTGEKIEFITLPDVMIKLLNDGGLIAHLNKNGDFELV